MNENFAGEDAVSWVIGPSGWQLVNPGADDLKKAMITARYAASERFVPRQERTERVALPTGRQSL
jgi:hypothetical protein